ncbi:CHAT domain-containing protein [Polymorphobacter arshaanensis]|nr:CHAT domain-containing protein [Polymorphobacter arshaanensis]
MAFADDGLPALNAERKGITDALYPAKARGSIDFAIEPSSGIADIFQLFIRNDGRGAVFHYGGHASKSTLELKAVDGAGEVAHAEGLADFLGRQRGLQLVFLNACSTVGHVELLLAAGVKAVIATAAPVNDEIARDFALSFYRSLGGGRCIQDAFLDAAAEVKSRSGDAAPIMETRGIGRLGAEPIDPIMLWALHVGPSAGDVLNWKIPTEDTRTVKIALPEPERGRANVLNTVLGPRLFEAAAPYCWEVQDCIRNAGRTGEPIDIDATWEEVAKAFPFPVGLGIRRLNADSNAGREWLTDAVGLYKATSKFFAFVVMIQLWENVRTNNKWKWATDQREIVLNFSKLVADDDPTFDYVGLILAGLESLRVNDVTPFPPQCADLSQALSMPAVAEARAGLQALQGRLADFPADMADDALCAQTEAQLAHFLAPFAFITGYDLAAFKDIKILQSRMKVIQFRHLKVRLAQISTVSSKDNAVNYDFYADNDSVLLMDRMKGGSPRWINLTPFIIDQNALNGQSGSKLHFFAGRQAEGSVFRFIENEKRTMDIDAQSYPEIHDQILDFRSTIERQL